MTRRCGALLVGALLFVVVVQVAQGVETYSVEPLADYPGASSTAYTAINDAGQMIGSADIPASVINGQQFGDTGIFRTEPYRSVDAGTDQITQPADAASATINSPAGINSNGQVVGRYTSGVYVTPANGSLQGVHVAPILYAAPAISNTGEIVSGNTVYTPDGSARYTTRSLGTGPAGFAPTGAAINSAGQVAGSVYLDGNNYRAFVTSPGAALNSSTDLIGTFGGPFSYAVSINATGVVAGYAATTVIGGGGPGAPPFNLPHAMYYDGTLHDLGTLGGASSVAEGINNKGQIVGTARTASGAGHAFVYEGDTMYDLNTLSPDGKWEIVFAEGINNEGVILVEEESVGTPGVSRNALLIPSGPAVPEPMPALLLVVGVMGLMMRLRWRDCFRVGE